MTRTDPWRRITLHFSQIFLTLGRTFIRGSRSLVSIGDPTSGEVVRGELHLHAVPRQDADVVHAHLPGDVRQHLVAVLEFHPEHGVGQRFDDRPLDQDRVVLGLGQDSPPTSCRARGKARKNLLGPTDHAIWSAAGFAIGHFVHQPHHER